MINKVVHIRSADTSYFNEQVFDAVAKMQNEQGLCVEVQYQATPMTDGHPYVIYSVLIIGRTREGK